MGDNLRVEWEDEDGETHEAAVEFEIPPNVRTVADFYPPGWPKCPACGLPVMEGHATCGNVRCSGGER